MKKIKTANSKNHNYKKNFNKYLRTTSTRSIRAIMRTKRLDAGFFPLEFYPALRDLFLDTHRIISEKDFEILLQLFSNQPFSVEDVYDCTMRKRKYDNIDWESRFNLGRRAGKEFLDRLSSQKIITLYKKHGRYNKDLYNFSTKYNSDLRAFYENMYCVRKVRMTSNEEFPTAAKKSIPHYKKMLKQNNYKDAFDNDFDTELKTDDNSFRLKLHEARAKSRL